MNPAKKNIVSELIKTANDIQEALKDLLGETLQDMLEAEMNEYLGYEKYSRNENVENSRNGYKSKKVRSSMGEFEIDFSFLYYLSHINCNATHKNLTLS